LGFARQPFVDLALIMGVMSFIGGVVLAGVHRTRGEMTTRAAPALLIVGCGAQVIACLGIAPRDSGKRRGILCCP
jgi:hypothetical protein